jgi:hypothetical protein
MDKRVRLDRITGTILQRSRPSELGMIVINQWFADCGRKWKVMNHESNREQCP